MIKEVHIWYQSPPSPPPPLPPSPFPLPSSPPPPPLPLFDSWGFLDSSIIVKVWLRNSGQVFNQREQRYITIILVPNLFWWIHPKYIAYTTCHVFTFVCCITTSSFSSFDSFGCKFRSTVTGIVYNNEMGDFSTPGQLNPDEIKPSKSNYIKPRKRPQSSISPVIFTDGSGRVKLVAGASGGPHITTAVSLVS